MALTSGRLGAGVATGPSDTGNILKKPQPKLAQQAVQGQQGPSMGNSSFPTYDKAAQEQLASQMFNLNALERAQQAGPVAHGLEAAGLRTAANADQARLGVDQGLVGQERGFANRGFDLARQLLDVARGRDLRLAGESSTARGATVSQGYRSELGEIEGAYQGNLGQAGLGRDKALANLDAQAAKMGITANELRRSLQIGLDKLGLSGFLDAQKIEDMLASGRKDLIAMATQVLNQAHSTDQAIGAGPSLGGAFGGLPNDLPGSATAALQAAGTAGGVGGGGGLLSEQALGGLLGVPYPEMKNNPDARYARMMQDTRNEPWWKKILPNLIGGG